MKKLLILILMCVGVLVLLTPIGKFKGEAFGNIMYRKNLVTGIITADNGDKSYAVEIEESGKSIKKIFTLSPDPDLAVGDKARVLYRDGNKEDRILLAPTKPSIPIPPVIRRYALIIAYPNELKVFDMEGAALYLLTTGGWSYAGCAITMDADGNSYAETNWNTLRKWDSSGNLLVTHSREHYQTTFESLNIGPDGYLYTLEGRASGYAITKRSTMDLTVIEDVVTLTGNYGGGICLDSNGNFYVYNWTADEIQKWSSAGVKLASIDPGNMSEYAGCGVCGDYVYFVKDTNEVYYLPLDLSTRTIWNLPSSIAYALTIADGHIILSGWDDEGEGATSKYDSGRNLIWTERLAGDAAYAYKAGGYNF